MLSALIKYEKEIEPLSLLSLDKDNLKHHGNKIIILYKNKEISTLTIKHNEVFVSFSGNLSFDEFSIINKVINRILSINEAYIDDKNSLLGYLQDGTHAYIYTNWSSWVFFINEAKFKTLEGNKVIVKNNQEQELGSGLLIDYTFEVCSSSLITFNRCTLITTLGERTFTGSQLTIVPTDRW
ncbi:hypothetical protein [Litchfieldia alkalitelluris]|uniref:hypothetical protein n=1 Tax=Litchfieldia alkalitelluris TaxID=304268 RepID=UPI0009974035|nr:hypothetical protein [Litchfieldia alkalitelluris]